MKVKGCLFNPRSKSRPLRQIFGSLLLLWLIAGGLISCSTPVHQAVFSEAKKNQNPYYAFYSQQTSEFQSLLSKSAFHLLRGSNSVFLSTLAKPQTPQGFFKNFPSPFSHGDFHVDQMAKINSVDTLDDLDTADFLPLWVDLTRLETSALIVAGELSLKDFESGFCTKAYIDTLASKEPVVLGKPYFTDKTLAKIASAPTKKEAYVPGPWTDSRAQRVDTEIKNQLKQSFEKLFPDNKMLEAKKVSSGVGSFLTLKYMVQSSKGLYYEFKELEKEPLSAFQMKPQNLKTPNPCERFTIAVQNFRPGAPLNCVEIKGQFFSVIPYFENYESPDLKKITQAEQLKNHVAWMCSTLAAAQAKNSFSKNPQELQNFLALWRSNSLIGERILINAQSQSQIIIQGYRMVLETQIQK